MKRKIGGWEYIVELKKTPVFDFLGFYMYDIFEVVCSHKKRLT